MNLLLHDLTNDYFNYLLPSIDKNIKVISNEKEIHNCIGCFGCWIKTPSTCIINDDYKNMGKLISKCDELIIISECFYGGLSPFVKNVLDRSISYVHPYLVIRNGEMHHKSRYNKQIKLIYHLYGNISCEEKVTAKNLIKANKLNLNAHSCSIKFYKNMEGLKKVIL